MQTAAVRRLGLALMLGTIATAVIATQWRFHYDFNASSIHQRWLRLDWRWFPRTRGHISINQDVVLNLLMLVPLGVGFALWRRASRARIVIEALLLGFVTSATLELTQLAMPYRYTTWGDLWRNTVGCVAGAIIVLALRRATAVSAKP